jgi:hypothetical protein
MKQKKLYLLLVILSVSFLSCSEGPINKIIIQNKAAGDVYLNFKGSTTEVLSGATVELQDLDKGEYEYETVFSVPYNATTFNSDGEMTGTFKIGAGTKIAVIYTSVLIEGEYTIYASVTTSEDQSENWWDNIIDPIGN